MGKNNFNWKDAIPHFIEVAQNLRDRIGTAPTLRGLYYALVSDETIPNTKNAYKGLSRVLTKARKDGVFPWYLIKDETRNMEDSGECSFYGIPALEKKAENIAEEYIKTVKNSIRRITDADVSLKVNKWENQPERVIIMVEKNAIMDAVKNFTRGLNVDILEMRGYASATSMKDLAERIHEEYTGYDVTVLLLTDFDPSGEDIARYAEECLTYDFGVNATFQKIGVNYEHVDQYNLPSAPASAAERAKMQRDPRFQNWGYGFFRVEVDALLAIVPEEFKRIIRDAVLSHYDKEIETEVKERVQELESEANERLEELYDMIAPLMDALTEYENGGVQ